MAPFAPCCAALLLLCMAGAHAQTGVTAFGTLDASAERVKSAGPAANRISSNSSGFGLRGSEDLGRGMRALFQVEGGISVDTGNGAVNTRDTFVGLSGSFGTLRAGLMTSPLRALGGKLNFVPGGTSVANNMGVMSTLNGLHAGLNSRLPNSVQYALPRLGAVTATLVFAPGETRPGGDSDASHGAGLNYEHGPWFLGLAYEDRGAQRKLALGASNDFERRVVARYTAGGFTFNAGWDRLGSDGLYGSPAALADGGVQRDAWTASAMFRRAQHDVMLHYSRANRLRCTGAARSGQCAPAAVNDTGAWQVSLLYHYSLSKRSMLLAYYSAIHNQASARYDFDANPVVAALAARTPGARPAALGWGIRHSY